MDRRQAIDAAVSGPGEGRAIWFLNNRVTLKATAATTGGAFALWEILAAPGDSPPLHIHHREEESFYVIEGRLTLRCGERTFGAGPGSLVVLPRDVPHTFLVEDAGIARFLGLMTPAGGEEFFVEMGRAAKNQGLPPYTQPDVGLLKQAASRYAIEIVGPPMTLPGS